MSRRLVQLYDAREVFQTEAAAWAAVEEVQCELRDDGLVFRLVHVGGGAHYALARRRTTHQLVGYVGHAWEE